MAEKKVDQKLDGPPSLFTWPHPELHIAVIAGDIATARERADKIYPAHKSLIATLPDEEYLPNVLERMGHDPWNRFVL